MERKTVGEFWRLVRTNRDEAILYLLTEWTRNVMDGYEDEDEQCRAIGEALFLEHRKDQPFIPEDNEDLLNWYVSIIDPL